MIDRPDASRLDSWKEIAAHLRRSVRTVKRWEKEEGLQVHRHLHQRLGTVHAFTTEVDEWLKTRGAPAVVETRRRRARAVSIAGVIVVAALASVFLFRSAARPQPLARVMIAVLPFENL